MADVQLRTNLAILDKAPIVTVKVKGSVPLGAYFTFIGKVETFFTVRNLAFFLADSRGLILFMIRETFLAPIIERALGTSLQMAVPDAFAFIELVSKLTFLTGGVIRAEVTLLDIAVSNAISGKVGLQSLCALRANSGGGALEAVLNIAIDASPILNCALALASDAIPLQITLFAKFM